MSLVEELIKAKYLKTGIIIKAFQKIKRQDFLRPGDEHLANLNAPAAIGYGQTNSQPLTVAMMFELLQPRPGDKVLDVGSGSGWTMALLAEIVGPEGTVFGVERINELKKFAQTNLNKYNLLKNGNVQIFCSDGYRGLPDSAPFDKIIVAAAAETIPDRLLEQLKTGGRMVIPLGRQGENQELALVDKISETEFRETRYPGFAFVPLIKS